MGTKIEEILTKILTKIPQHITKEYEKDDYLKTNISLCKDAFALLETNDKAREEFSVLLKLDGQVNDPILHNLLSIFVCICPQSIIDKMTIKMIKTLEEWMPYDAFNSGHWNETNPFWKYKNVKVTIVHDEDDNMDAWPGRHKNVIAWWELENGYAVGWNRNRITGHSFPVIRIKKTIA